MCHPATSTHASLTPDEQANPASPPGCCGCRSASRTAATSSPTSNAPSGPPAEGRAGHSIDRLGGGAERRTRSRARRRPRPVRRSSRRPRPATASAARASSGTPRTASHRTTRHHVKTPWPASFGEHVPGRSRTTIPLSRLPAGRPSAWRMSCSCVWRSIGGRSCRIDCINAANATAPVRPTSPGVRRRRANGCVPPAPRSRARWRRRRSARRPRRRECRPRGQHVAHRPARAARHRRCPVVGRELPRQRNERPLRVR